MMMQVITQKTAASRAQNTVQKATAVVEMVSVSVRLVCLDQRVICRVLMVLGVLTVSMNVAVTHPTVSAATHGYVALSLHDIPPGRQPSHPGDSLWSAVFVTNFVTDAITLHEDG